MAKGAFFPSCPEWLFESCSSISAIQALNWSIVFNPDRTTNKNVDVMIADIANWGASAVDIIYKVTKFETIPIAVVEARSLLRVACIDSPCITV